MIDLSRCVRCKQPLALIYLGKPLCWMHWIKQCADEKEVPVVHEDNPDDWKVYFKGGL